MACIRIGAGVDKDFYHIGMTFPCGLVNRRPGRITIRKRRVDFKSFCNTLCISNFSGIGHFDLRRE